MDNHDEHALLHYQTLIAQFYPPTLAAALAAARYQAGLTSVSLPLLRDQLVTVQEAHPDLKRDVGRTVAAIDRRGTIKDSNSRQR